MFRIHLRPTHAGRLPPFRIHLRPTHAGRLPPFEWQSARRLVRVGESRTYGFRRVEDPPHAGGYMGMGRDPGASLFPLPLTLSSRVLQALEILDEGVEVGGAQVASRAVEVLLVVLAEDLTQEALFEAIRGGRSLACEDVNGRLRLAGPFELIDFADFYHRRLLPQKRRIMGLEAQLALSALRGGAYDRGVVEKLDKELDRFERKAWA